MFESCTGGGGQSWPGRVCVPQFAEFRVPFPFNFRCGAAAVFRCIYLGVLRFAHAAAPAHAHAHTYSGVIKRVESGNNNMRCMNSTVRVDCVLRGIGCSGQSADLM